MIRLLATLQVILLLTGIAHARSEDGTLGILRVPNNGQPAIVMHGESFTIRAQGRPDIFVDMAGQLLELTANWHSIKNGLDEASVALPTDFAPGLHTIVGILGDTEDVQPRALLVLDDEPIRYHVAHIPSPGIQAAQEASLAGTGGLITVVTGNLTANGTADEFRTLLDWLNTSPNATIIAPGRRDSVDNRFGDYFDTAPHTTWCGRDAYITIGETFPQAGDDVTGEAAAYEQIRRATKPARWSIGISGYAYDALSLRMQIVLFVDIPLHAFVSGRARPNAGENPTASWDSFQGPTRILAPSAERAPGIQWIHVTRAGVAVGGPPTEDEQ